MEKLIFTYEYCDEPDYTKHQIPFEFSSKDDFVYKVLEDIEKAKSKGDHYIYIFDISISLSRLYDLESMVTTLDDWFNINKEIYKL